MARTHSRDPAVPGPEVVLRVVRRRDGRSCGAEMSEVGDLLNSKVSDEDVPRDEMLPAGDLERMRRDDLRWGGEMRSGVLGVDEWLASVEGEIEDESGEVLLKLKGTGTAARYQDKGQYAGRETETRLEKEDALGCNGCDDSSTGRRGGSGVENGEDGVIWNGSTVLRASRTSCTRRANELRRSLQREKARELVSEGSRGRKGLVRTSEEAKRRAAWS